ncbi:MAG: tyrosine-protein phosphatase [Porticoccaceae bacterium]
MSRFLNLGKTMNLRHMGGYPVAGGRMTDGGKLFRSGFLHLPDDHSVSGFKELGVDTVYDFRSPMERTKNDLRVEGAATVVELGMLVASVENLWDMLLAEGLTPAGAEKIMCERYRELTAEEIPGYRTMFQHMLDDDGGALVMCSFGKDRAGIASALLLTALGVPEQVVLEDYLLSSNAYADRDAAVKKFEQFFNSEGIALDPAIVAPILDARAQYLDTAWQVMSETAGSPDAFLTRELGLDPAAREFLVQRFTR